MSYSIIAAIGRNNELGKNNKLIWNLPSDLKFFRDITNGKTIIMGRKTFESLPKMLPNRHHIVLSSSNNFPKEVEVYKDIKKLLENYKNYNDELFVIGGASIYELFIPFTNKLYLTDIDAVCDDADAFFPVFDENDYNKLLLKSNEENGLYYEHNLYLKK